jgi:hypothetical protein
MLLETKKQVVKHRLQLKEQWEAKKKNDIYKGRKNMSTFNKRNRSLDDRDYQDEEYEGNVD